MARASPFWARGNLPVDETICYSCSRSRAAPKPLQISGTLETGTTRSNTVNMQRVVVFIVAAKVNFMPPKTYHAYVSSMYTASVLAFDYHESSFICVMPYAGIFSSAFLRPNSMSAATSMSSCIHCFCATAEYNWDELTSSTDEPAELDDLCPSTQCPDFAKGHKVVDLA